MTEITSDCVRTLGLKPGETIPSVRRLPRLTPRDLPTQANTKALRHPKPSNTKAEHRREFFRDLLKVVPTQGTAA